MNPKRILIVSGAALSRNPRVLKAASTLAGAGYMVTVLTLRNHAAAEKFDRDIMATANFQRVVLDVATTPSSSPIQVLRRRARAATARWLARRLGMESIETIGPAGELLGCARRHPAELVIGHTELGLWVAAHLLTEGRKVAADFEDWHSEDLLPADRMHRPLQILRDVERRLLRDAAFVTTTSAAMSHALQNRYGGPTPAVIANAFPLQIDPFALNPLHAELAGPPRLCWFSQTIGPGRGLEEFLDAWALTQTPSRLFLLGESSVGYRDSLLARLPATHRAMVGFNSPVAPAELPGWIAQHHVGLALERTDIPNRDLTITNKILQYLNAGLAVIATSTAGQREVLLAHPQAGFLIDLHAPPQDTAKQIDHLLATRGLLAAGRTAARQAAATDYCWEQQAPRLLSLVEKALP